MQHIRGRAVLIGLLLVLSVMYLVPTALGDARPSWWPVERRISLGLDLKGGVHMVYEVEVEKAAEAEVRRLADWMGRELEDADVAVEGIDSDAAARTVTVRLEKAEDRTKVESTVAKRAKGALEVEAGSGAIVTLAVEPDLLRDREAGAVSQAIEVIRNRIDQYGVGEAAIQRQGARRILVQLPGVTDPTEAKKLIQGTAQLEFRLIDHDAETALADILAKLRFPTLDDTARTEAAKLLEGHLPEHVRWYFQIERDPITRETRLANVRLVKDEIVVSGANLEDARVSFDQLNRPQVAFEFDTEGAEKFADVTGKNRDKQLAIVLDDTIYSSPVIRSRIGGGRGVIEGQFDVTEAQNLAIVLRAGALPAPLELLEERSVGPELGQKSVDQGRTSIVLGGLLVVLFMAVYYKKAGVIADAALVLNVIFIMAALAGFRASLTLPGIAGIILTVGMAVDANVIVFERIREELRAGKSPSAAVDAGYGKALWTVLDANITTLIAALVLFQFGTGPVRGFAVTLSIGVVTSVFTALVVTRTCFDYLLGTRRVKELSI